MGYGSCFQNILNSQYLRAFERPYAAATLASYEFCRFRKSNSLSVADFSLYKNTYWPQNAAGAASYHFIVPTKFWGSFCFAPLVWISIRNGC